MLSGLLWVSIIIIWLSLSWIILTRWVWFTTNYFLVSANLLITSILLLYSAKYLFGLDGITWRIIGVFSIILALIFCILFLIKVTYLQNSRLEKTAKVFRSMVTIEPSLTSFEYNKLSNEGSQSKRLHLESNLFTEDNVKIRITHIKSGNPNVIIIAHGAFRNRHTIPYVILAQWLAYDYDVVLLDFRGHGESGGYFDFSDTTVLDLKAVIDYVHQQDYKKIGVFSRSMGAWTTLLEAAKYNNIDSIIAAASPLRQITDISHAKMFERIIRVPIVGILISPFAQLAISIIRNTRISMIRNASQCPIDVVRNLEQIPIFLIYQEYDPVIETTAAEAIRLYDALPGTKDLLILAGPGHIFELQQFFGLYQRIERWFNMTL